jgi:hypothetical protein
MPVPGATLLFSPRGMVTATALKWSGTSVTVGSLVAAITVRVIADGAGGVCALAETASVSRPKQYSVYRQSHDGFLDGKLEALYALLS